jgi:hypothetical protein
MSLFIAWSSSWFLVRTFSIGEDASVSFFGVSPALKRLPGAQNFLRHERGDQGGLGWFILSSLLPKAPEKKVAACP